uniref:Ribosomal RNA methyltransferase FtsJ domain-containing protein n=1 Tax=viral metagenome TaxID=1070528 RepID=A0A6C0JWD6_9ZZZZ
MEAYIQEKPPWKCVEWIKSSYWATLPEIEYVEWISDPNESAVKIKEEIRELDKEHKWELAKKMVNPYELVYTHDDDRLPPSLSLEYPLSRSFFKMIEILNVSNFFDSFGKNFNNIRSVHVAEGPGGFIQALHNRAEVKGKTVANSFAMTLKPTNPHVPGWKKATQFLQKYKQVKIHYGVDGTGDIYSCENQESFIHFSSPKAHIFTADGGFDFSIDYSLQEQRVFHLLICSITVGLRSLIKGGQFVLKLFDCTSPNTKSLVLILSRCFGDWTLYKPAMTRPCNSERYFIGRDFRGNSADPIVKSLLEIQQQSANGKYPVLKPELLSEIKFLERHIESTTSLQIGAIKLAISLIKNQDEWWKLWYMKCLKKSLSWCEMFKVSYITENSHISTTRSRFAAYF